MAENTELERFDARFRCSAKNCVEFTDYRQKPSNIKHVSDRFTDSLLAPAVDTYLAREKKLLGGGWKWARVSSSRGVGVGWWW